MAISNLTYKDYLWIKKENSNIYGIRLSKSNLPTDIAYMSNLDNYTRKTITLPDNINLDTVTESGFYRLSMNPNFPHAQMIVSRGADTIAQMAFPYADTNMYVRTGNPFNTSGGLWHDWKQVAFTDHTHTSINTAFVFKNNDMPEAEGSASSANLAGTTTAHKLTLYRNGLSIPYQMDDSNDGGILRCRGTSESNTIFELATWDDYGTGETIQFNYYPTTSQATPTYSVTVPKKTGTIALTSDLDNYVKLNGNQTISGAKTFTNKISNTYLTGGILDTHPESGGTIIGYYTNDWAYLLKRGYSAAARNVTQNTTIEPDECWFDTSPSYDYLSLTSTSDVVEIIIKGPSMLWTTKGGIGFGSPVWRAKNVKIEVGYTATNKGTASNPDSDIVWVTRIDVTNQGEGIVFGNINGPTEAEGGHSTSAFTYMRLTLTNWNNKTPRIAQIFTFTVGSIGMHNAFLSKGGGNFYGSIWPTPSNTYDLGNNSNRWASVHAKTFYENGKSLADKYLGINGTAKKSNYLISPSDVPTNANISDKENTNKAKLRVDLATSSMTTNKPVDDGFIYTNIWDINNSKNNNSQLYIPNGYHITNGRRLSVRGCKDDTWQTSWKELAYYSDIPTVNNPKITIKQGGTEKGSFTLNQSGGTTIELTDNNTTYSAGTGLSLNSSNNTFSVKTGYTTDANNRNYKVAADSSGNLYVNVPWSVGGTIDTSLSSSSTNALQNKAIYSAFSSAVGYDNNYYAYGEKGSWRMHQYNKTGNSLDIKYGVITINSQSANYSVSFSGKNFASTNYTVVFGLYRSNAQSWFWSPIVQSKTTSGFTVFLRGNSGGDNGGTIMYIAIRSN